jgi:hypothetical protein
LLNVSGMRADESGHCRQPDRQIDVDARKSGMIANSAVLAAIVLVVLIVLLLEQLPFLVPYRRIILTYYLWVIVSAVVVVFLNLFALFYAISRRLFLKDTGRKLAHVEQQLRTRDTIARDLSERLSRDA